MKASGFEFRWRYLLHGVIYALGFVAPWNYVMHADPRGASAHVWGLLAANLAMGGVLSFAVAFQVLLGLGIACSLLGAILRTWGGAYLGAPVVEDSAMHGERVLTDGPYRYMRNPLYVGTFFYTLALALLMPRSGAVLTIVLIGLYQVRLALAEEAFLKPKLGAAYEAYCAAVPRVWPKLKSGVMPSGLKPRWGQAAVGELAMWGTAVAFCVLGWQYNPELLMQCVVVSFGLSMVVKALVKKSPAAVVERA